MTRNLTYCILTKLLKYKEKCEYNNKKYIDDFVSANN